MHVKEEYVIHITNLKQAIKIKINHYVIKINQKDCLKSFIDMYTGLKTKAKKSFEKDFFKLINIAVFGKTMENVRRYRDIKLVTMKQEEII